MHSTALLHHLHLNLGTHLRLESNLQVFGIMF